MGCGIAQICAVKVGSCTLQLCACASIAALHALQMHQLHFFLQAMS